MGSVFVNGIEQERAGQSGGHLSLIVGDVRLLDKDDDSYYGERRVFECRWFERNHSCWHLANDRKMWREFAAGWENIGRPIFKCAYCTQTHLQPAEPGTPVCTEERFVRGLVYTFPMLHRRVPGIAPWKPEKWARWWLTSGAQTGGSHPAVAFVLHVWGGAGKEARAYWKRRGYEFDLSRALQSWDEAHRNAFRKWVANPWWP